MKKKRLTGNVRIYAGVDAAIFAYYSKKAVSGIEREGGGFGLLFYGNGSNRGEVKFLEMRQLEDGTSVHNGMRYWKWELSRSAIDFDDGEVKDFVVWLPKIAQESQGEFSMVTKEWSPLMLEHYDYSKVGIEAMVKEEGWI